MNSICTDDVGYEEGYLWRIKIGGVKVSDDNGDLHDLPELYQKMLDEVKTHEDLEAFCTYWGKFSSDIERACKELSSDQWPLWEKFRSDKDFQNEALTSDPPLVPGVWCSLMVPLNFIPILIVAEQYGITYNLALLRLFHVGAAYIDDNGYLRFALPDDDRSKLGGQFFEMPYEEEPDQAAGE